MVSRQIMILSLDKVITTTLGQPIDKIEKYFLFLLKLPAILYLLPKFYIFGHFNLIVNLM